MQSKERSGKQGGLNSPSQSDEECMSPIPWSGSGAALSCLPELAPQAWHRSTRVSDLFISQKPIWLFSHNWIFLLSFFFFTQPHHLNLTTRPKRLPICIKFARVKRKSGEWKSNRERCISKGRGKGKERDVKVEVERRRRWRQDGGDGKVALTAQRLLSQSLIFTYDNLGSFKWGTTAHMKQQ